MRGTTWTSRNEYESVEILGMVTYLLNRSEPFEYLPPAEGVESASAERGKVAFEVRGCTACHQHDDFPYATSVQGPNLTHLADKFSAAAAAPNAKAWLYSWIRRPTHYHARTKMPDLYLDPVTEEDGRVTDPVADIVEYLLSSSKQWQPPEESVAALQPNEKDLDGLVLDLLEATFPVRRAEEYLKTGLPEEIGPSLKGAEVELVGEISDQKKLLYVGRKAISKYGCYGCHDIPGFEDAKPIGTVLAEWGYKESSKLAFEHILEYLHNGGHGGHGAHGDHAVTDGNGNGHDEQGFAVGTAVAEHVTDHGRIDTGSTMSSESPSLDERDANFDESFYMEQLKVADRSGFIWQKLKEPRSYDYMKTANKRYNERLRMPHFPLSKTQREAIITFVLGLVADPPAEEFVYDPTPHQAALVAGRRVLEKYNCGGCHVLEAEKWKIEFEPGELGSPPSVVDYPFLASHFSDKELEQSETVDPQRGVLTAVIRGMPAISNDDGTVLVLDEEGDPIDPEEEYDPDTLQYPFDLWQPLAFEGKAYEVGVRRLDVPAADIKQRWPAKGGDLTRWLLPRVVEIEKQSNPAANGTEAWSWLPPPLVGEGRKVQPDWLHSFLLEPYKIRPATFLRMPKFNMSPDEATQLVNYFAAQDAAEYPFEFDDRILANHLPEKEAMFAAHATGGKTRLEQAMQIVTDKNYCIKCHLIGEFMPESTVRIGARPIKSTIPPAAGVRAELDRQSETDSALHRDARQCSVL